MFIPTLTTHAEKVQFVQRFLRGGIPEYPNDRPLMLLGSGGNGKTKVVQEVAENADVNILVFQGGDSHRFFPSAQYSDRCVILITANGGRDEMEFGRLLNAQIVMFDKDPAYTNVGISR